MEILLPAFKKKYQKTTIWRIDGNFVTSVKKILSENNDLEDRWKFCYQRFKKNIRKQRFGG